MRSTLLAATNAKKLVVAGLATGCLTLLLTLSLQAQPTGGRILSDITVSGDDACKVAQIAFSFPIRYINHFPQSESDELRIQLQPITVDAMNKQDLSDREAFSPVYDATLLNNVIYEGDMTGGPYLTLQFSAKTSYTVTQGTDFRSISVTFHPADVTCPVASSSAF